MENEILRVRLTQNLKQLKKYVDEAILKGADKVRFDMDKENPYFIFSTDFTPEEQNQYDIQQLKERFNNELKLLERKKYKTFSFRIKEYGLCGNEINNLVEKFRLTNKIKDCLQPKIKQVITNEYDDFEDCMKTVFVTQILDA